MNKKILWVSLFISIVFTLAIFSFLGYQAVTTYHAHDTFVGYCHWRGLQVINQSSGFGYCGDNSGNTYKIIQYNGRWYLGGDLPGSGLFN